MKVFILLSLCFSSISLVCSGNSLDGEWWKHTIIYEMLPFSFQDSNGDGFGDIRGIISKLDHFDNLKIETIHMTPIFKTGLRDMGYDIYDYFDIDPRFGTMKDFEDLMDELKKRNMKLILDLVINHSSDKHKWFQKSVRKIEPYKDFYVWKNARGFSRKTGKPIPPNKWRGVFSGKPGSAWTWNSKRKQFYLHQFLKDQPDFDLNNPILKNELKKIMKFWLDKGVAGFRLDAVIFYMEDKYFRDDDPELRQVNQDETYEFVHEMREFLDDYNRKQEGFERIFIAEAHSDDHFVRRYYDRDGYNITHFPYTFNLRYINSEITSYDLNERIEPWLNELPPNAVSAWMTQDHDGHRVGSRIRWEYMDILTTLSMLLPGTVGIYYGQEIGMLDGPIEQDQIKDYSGGGSRDPARLPMQWDSSANGGFSTSQNTFLPASHDYTQSNVELQKRESSNINTHYKLFKDLSNLRQTDTFKYGDFQSYTPHKDIYSFSRWDGRTMIIVIVNLKSCTFSINLPKLIESLPDKIYIVAVSKNLEYKSGIEVGSDILTDFILQPYGAVVFKAYNENEMPTPSVDYHSNEESNSSSDESFSSEEDGW